MKKIIKQILLSSVMCLLLLSTTIAHATNSDSSDVTSLDPPNGIAGDQLEYDTERSNSRPTSSHSLPYTTGATTINQSVYTDYMFKPNSSGKLQTTFNGYLTNLSGGSTSATATVTIRLYEQGNTSALLTHSYSSGNTWTDKMIEWSGLDSNTYYYFKISKTNILTNLVFSLKIESW